MTSGSNESDPFGEEDLAATADEHELDAKSLSALVRRHQKSIAALPGIENLAYEWRKQYDAPVVERTPDAYYLAVPAWVWDEFGDALDLDTTSLEALIDIHRRTVATRTDAPPSPPDGHTYVVLNRRVDDA